MNAQIDLNQTEKASFKLAAYGDGTIDLSLGLMFLLLGAFPLTRGMLGPVWNALFFLVALSLIGLAQVLIRKRLSPSRIGLVKFGPHVVHRIRTALLITVVLLVITVLVWVGAARGIFFSLPAWMGNYGVEIIAALIILAIFWGVAYSLELQRYYLYGILLAAIFPLQQLLPVYHGLPYLVSGGIITIIGAVLLARFLKAYPPQEEEA